MKPKELVESTITWGERAVIYGVIALLLWGILYATIAKAKQMHAHGLKVSDLSLVIFGILFSLALVGIIVFDLWTWL